MIRSLGDPLCSESSSHCKSQTGRARELPQCVTCQVSHVTCQESVVTCQVSSVSIFFYIGGASWWRICYQRGLPRPDGVLTDCDMLYVVKKPGVAGSVPETALSIIE